MLGSLGNIEIGAELGIFSDTVKKHRAQVMAKMQVTKRSDLVTLWQGIEPQG